MKRKHRIHQLDHFALLTYRLADSQLDIGATQEDVIRRSYGLALMIMEERKPFIAHMRAAKKLRKHG